MRGRRPRVHPAHEPDRAAPVPVARRARRPARPGGSQDRRRGSRSRRVAAPAGEAGVGKSRLVGALFRKAEAADWIARSAPWLPRIGSGAIDLRLPAIWGLAEADLVDHSAAAAIERCEGAFELAVAVGERALLVPFVVRVATVTPPTPWGGARAEPPAADGPA